MNTEEQQQLLQLARETIIACTKKLPLPVLSEPSKTLCVKAGCFVTIKRNGQLRGCIGSFVSDLPLWETVREMAVSAATRDPRFTVMQEEELSDFGLEVSVLSPLRDISSIDEIEVGKHGIYLIKGGAQGVLLPQVATEFGWDRDTFLRQTCRKAGLPEDAWQHNCRILIFTADIFGD
ncbi:MAG: AmmeMemoRadiSam system protein A [Trichlorobacter sp.]|jgi:AmmeMemoRadiSam system protein A|nr:AmmeMemoRadiSam system protein A [Trichlorobacter sp.]